MMSHIIRGAGAAGLLALLLFVGTFHAPRSAQAAIPPPCPAGASAPGPAKYRVFATLPVGAVSTGVCVVLPSAAPIGGGAVVQAPACPPPAPFAATVAGGPELVWADFGAPCVAGGQTVILEFTGPAVGVPIGRQPGAAHWDGGVVGDATVWPTVPSPAVPAPCPLTGPGPAGAVPLKLVAPVPPIPPGALYDGVCISFPLGPISIPAAVSGPAGCGTAVLSPQPPAPNTAVGPFFSLSSLAAANENMLWVDWTTKCASPPGVLTMFFQGPAALIGVCAACATWLDGAVTGDVTVTAASSASSVGGIAQAPDLAAPAPVARAGGAGVDRGWYAGGGVFFLLALTGGGWYVRRRLRVGSD
jgi:hypothetical protein